MAAERFTLDGELIRRDGLFVTEELAALNPEELLAATAS